MTVEDEKVAGLHICIHRGAHQIGGTCIELESQGHYLILDIGLPLDAPHPNHRPQAPSLGAL
jgi:ribonuclease J